jgi:hypothetical protein
MIMRSMQAPRKNNPPSQSILHAKKRFRGYGPESNIMVREKAITGDPTLKPFVDAWDAFRCDALKGLPSVDQSAFLENTQANYQEALSLVKALRCSAEDLDRFMVLLPDLQSVAAPSRPSNSFVPKHIIMEYINRSKIAPRTGLFLSALINSGSDHDYLVRTRVLPYEPMHLGFRNNRNIDIDGNAGKGVGHHMSDGVITVKGDAGEEAGSNMSGGLLVIRGDAGEALGACMEGGEIICEGDAAVRAASSMRGGRITINGDAHYYVMSIHPQGGLSPKPFDPPLAAHGMEGGELHLNGNYGLSPDVEGGKIYHKGKLVLEK